MAPLFVPSELFTVGRACAGPLAVVLHNYDSGIEMLDLEMQRCRRPRYTQSPGCHTSFHYGAFNEHLHQYVLTANTAFGFGVQSPTCPEPPCPPGECESCTGLTVGQYNPDMDGNPPVLPALVAGPDGTANCGVIHVAVGNIFPSYIGGICCDPNDDAYQGLVRSLAYIFTAAGLVPSQTTLLVHCGELLCLDIDQLVLDVIEAQIVVPPAVVLCNCTPTVAQLCEAISNVPAGAVAVPGVTVLLGADCFTHVLPAADVTLVALDTATANTTIVEAPVNTFTVSVDVLPAVLSSIETCDGPYEVGDLLVNANDVPIATATTDTSTIWASDGEAPCPAPLEGVPFNPSLPLTSVVLGVNSITNTPQWSIVTAPPLVVDTFTNLVAAVSPDDGDVLLYTGAGDHSVTLNAGTSRNSLWIKNVSGNVLTITPAVGTVDGVASISLLGTIPAGYPFGNNGGETAHLVFDGANWFVI